MADALTGSLSGCKSLCS